MSNALTGRHRPGRASFTARFILLNGGLFFGDLFVSTLNPAWLRYQIFGEVTVGLALLFAQGALLVWTAARYDSSAPGEAK
ncbi:hypothetical protein [Streptomyces sp. AC495_CC817]|uniref:hypothetical protein n=1 Tax=Streptomyces sp. AC495_CC817 TaxID=2823900 RepID=UPI001C2570A3|nr:hypothetical protein [Streptomyces sp. AC495_CC817]